MSILVDKQEQKAFNLLIIKHNYIKNTVSLSSFTLYNKKKKIYKECYKPILISNYKGPTAKKQHKLT